MSSRRAGEGSRYVTCPRTRLSVRLASGRRRRASNAFATTTVAASAITRVLQRSKVLQRVEESAPRDLCVKRVANVRDRTPDAHEARRGRLVLVDELDVPVARREALRRQRARKTRADDDRMPRGRPD